MRREVIHEGPDGSTVAFYESPEERDERIAASAERARARLQLTPDMAEALRKALDREGSRCPHCGARRAT